MIEISTAIMFLVSTFSSTANTAIAQSVTDNINTQNETPIEQPLTLESYVRNYFKETPILAEIARCESTFRQFDSNGNPIRGKVNRDDVGLMQVNEHYHGETAEDLGFDLKTVDGNLAYAQYLYDKEGTRPWKASKPCWSKK